jgi:hypothetical protein
MNNYVNVDVNKETIGDHWHDHETTGRRRSGISTWHSFVTSDRPQREGI